MDIRAHVIALNEERAKVWEKQKALLDDTKGRERSAEETVSLERMDADLDRLDAEIRQDTKRFQREEDAAGIRAAQESIFGEARVERVEHDADLYLRDWVKRVRLGQNPEPLEVNLRGAAAERKAIREGRSPQEVRAMAWDVSSGSLLVPVQMARTLYEFLEAGIVGFRMGFTDLNTSNGDPIQLPKLKTHAVGTQIASQNLDFGGTDPTFARVQLDAFKYGELVQLANEMLDDPAIDISSWLAMDMGYALSRVINTALIAGDGSSKPQGYYIPVGSGTNTPVTTGGSLIAPTVENWIQTQYSINDQYRSKAAWLMADVTAGTIRRYRDGVGGTVGAFLWEPSLTNGLQNGTPDRFLGSPVYTDPNCSSGTNVTIAAYGMPSEYIFRHVGNPAVEADTSVGFKSDSTFFRAKWRVDGDHRDVTAINLLKQTV